jgi:hypothetical protein
MTSQLRPPGGIFDAFSPYAWSYRDTHGELIELRPLVVQMLRTFLNADREIQAWRRHRGGVAAGPGNGTGMESRNA